MIVEFVQFRRPHGWSRDQVLEDARATVPKWRAEARLVRKHYVTGENGMVGAFYIWPTRVDAERAHDAIWRAAVAAKTGAPPSISYFDLTMIVDNAAGSVTEFAEDEETWRG
jgi:hypothetical protein